MGEGKVEWSVDRGRSGVVSGWRGRERWSGPHQLADRIGGCAMTIS